MDHDALQALKTLTDAARLRILGRLATAPATAATLASELGMAPRDVRRHLGRLEAAELVALDGAASDPDRRYRLRLETLDRLGRALARAADETVDVVPGTGPAGEPMDAEDAKVLRGFFADDRLVAIPAQHAKRQVILRYLLDRCFAEDRDYPEKEVNQRLALFHPDVAALRRYLVDERFMTREAGIYRRAVSASRPAG
jgi:DNA-binding transcriptional ArsR family regulator